MRVREETKSRSQVAISEVHLTWPVRLVGCVSVAQFSSPRNECKTKVQHLRGGRPIDIKKERADSILTRVIIPYLSSNRIAIGCRSLLAGVAPFVQTGDRHRGPAVLPLCFATVACVTCACACMRACASCTWLPSSHLLARLARRTPHPHPSAAALICRLVGGPHTHSTSVIAAKKTVAILH